MCELTGSLCCSLLLGSRGGGVRGVAVVLRSILLSASAVAWHVHGASCCSLEPLSRCAACAGVFAAVVTWRCAWDINMNEIRSRFQSFSMCNVCGCDCGC